MQSILNATSIWILPFCCAQCQNDNPFADNNSCLRSAQLLYEHLLPSFPTAIVIPDHLPAAVRAGVFFDHVFNVFLFPQFLEQPEILRHIAPVLKAGIPRMGIQQFCSVFRARELFTFVAESQPFFIKAANPEFAAPFRFAFLDSPHLLRGTAQAGFTQRGTGPAIDSTGC
jgi:hypothetical protein